MTRRLSPEEYLDIDECAAAKDARLRQEEDGAIMPPGYHAQLAYTALGFRDEGTGGGCRAFWLDLDNGHYILVSTEEGGDVPTAADERVAVGLYSPTGEMLRMTFCTGAAQLGAWLRAGLWTKYRRTSLVLALCAEWHDYCAAHLLPPLSADELLTAPNITLSAPTRAWVQRFIVRWDRVQQASY